MAFYYVWLMFDGSVAVLLTQIKRQKKHTQNNNNNSGIYIFSGLNTERHDPTKFEYRTKCFYSIEADARTNERKEMRDKV